uniref:DUF6916 domain-containing protein n=1 Tax=Solibacter usitatus (strain Ellin6076) TaxID=234267 RepID=Q02CQ5_SOLUE
MIEQLDSKSFSQQLHTIFQVLVPDIGAVPLELIEVTEYTDQPKLEQFCLTFRGPRNPWFQQKTLPVEHEALGQMDLFIAPLGPDDQGMRYQVIFNRFRK